MPNDEQFYAAVADEIARGHIDKTLWTKAFANSGGEEPATKSLYCRLRAEQLQIVAKKQQRSVQIAFTKAHAKQLGFGSLAFIIGTALSAASYSVAKPGGHYIFTYSLIVGGFVAICKGLSGLVRSQFISPAPHSFSHSPAAHAAQAATATNQPSQQTNTTAAPPQPTQPTEGKRNISAPVGCLIIIVASTLIVAALISASSNSSTPASTPYIAPQRPPPSLVDPRAALTKTFSDLETEYRALAVRRANLDPNDSAQLEAFNRDAANYTRRVEQARAEKKRLGQ